jgi:ABC-type Fe3+-hydroxamate transport system substrate-binding protein
MADDGSRREVPTRREYMKYGGAIIGSGLLAGCAGDGGSESASTEQSTETETTTAAETTTTETETTETEDTSYSVSISPVGEVTFEEVPTSVMAYSPQYIDMLVALGHDDALNSVGFSSYVDTFEYFFGNFDGVSFSADGLQQLYNDGMDKELLYELDSDVHLQDPAWVTSFDAWSKTDTEEIAENVGPWFANRYSREHTQPPEGWRDGYQYYTIWEITEKVSQVFQEPERFQALKDEYEKLYGRIRSNLPPQSERPTVGLVAFWDGKFSPYKISGPGFGKAHTRPMGARDAFADSDKTYDENYGASYDFEGLLEVDPDVVLHNFAVTPFYDWDQIKETVTNDPVGEELTAVKNDRFYASGQSFQGPLQNLLQLEMTAKQLYPDQFGEWPRFEEGDSYPDFDEDEQLFDHQRVADIVNGDV